MRLQSYIHLSFWFSLWLASSLRADLAWTTAPSFTNGMLFTSSNYNRLVMRAEDIALSGVGDALWRQFWHAHSLLRNVVASAEEPTPADDVCWQLYLHLDPETQPDATWIGAGGLAGPGEEDGPNLYNPFLEFLYGNEAAGVWDESSRLLDFPVASTNLSALDGWTAGKLQRGFFTNGIIMPTNCARRVATDWRKIRLTAFANTAKLYNTTWGGWMPEWGTLPDYSDWYPYVFMPLRSALSALAFGQSNTVVYYGSDHYKVVSGGTTNWLPYDHYLLGPAPGAGVPTVGCNAMQFPGHAVDFMLQCYVGEYAGAWWQRTNDNFRLPLIAFDFQRFLTNQYRLAPAYASNYPVVTVSSNAPQTNCSAHAGFVLAGCKLSAGWSNAATVTISNGSVRLAALTASNTNVVVWFTQPATGAVVSVNTTNGGQCAVEFAELQQRTPDVEDCYMLLRLASTDGEGLGAVDNPGRLVANAASYTANYFRSGCLTGQVPPDSQTQDPAQSPVWNAVRRVIRDNMRAYTRNMFQGYWVSNGMGVLKFARCYQGLDNWDGIAPPMGDTTGTNYIRVDAPEHGWNNRWAMFLSSHCYNDTEASVWKPDAYGDVVTFLHDRCHCLSWDLDEMHGQDLRYLLDPEFRISENWGNPVMVSPAPSGWRYARTVNTGYGATNFFRSCELYPKPYEVLSVLNVGNGSNSVLVILDRPLKPAAAGERTDENIVTDYTNYLNGIGCPIRAGDFAASADSREGPSYTGTDTEDLWGVHNGACMPRFYFARLPRRCYEDTNNTYQSHDTRPTAADLSWMGFMLQSWCEGFLDPYSAVDFGCQAQGCWTWPNLCYRTSGAVPSRWYDLLVGPEMKSANKVGILGTNWLQDQHALSAGVLPNSVIYAETLDRLSRGFNALQAAPLDLPLSIYVSNVTLAGWMPVPYSASVGDGTNCQAASIFATNTYACWSSVFGEWCHTTNGESVYEFVSHGASTYDAPGATLSALPWLVTGHDSGWTASGGWSAGDSAYLAVAGFTMPGLAYSGVVLYSNQPVALVTKTKSFVRIDTENILLALRPELLASSNNVLTVYAWAYKEWLWHTHAGSGSHVGPGVCGTREECFSASLLTTTSSNLWECYEMPMAGIGGSTPVFSVEGPALHDSMLSTYECTSGVFTSHDDAGATASVRIYPEMCRLVLRVPFK